VEHVPAAGGLAIDGVGRIVGSYAAADGRRWGISMVERFSDRDRIDTTGAGEDILRTISTGTGKTIKTPTRVTGVRCVADRAVVFRGLLRKVCRAELDLERDARRHGPCLLELVERLAAASSSAAIDAHADLIDVVDVDGVGPVADAMECPLLHGVDKRVHIVAPAVHDSVCPISINVVGVFSDHGPERLPFAGKSEGPVFSIYVPDIEGG